MVYLMYVMIRISLLRLKPVVCFQKHPDLVLHYLGQHKLASALTWHNRALPSSEVWVKIGGDHG